MKVSGKIADGMLNLKIWK